MGGFLVRLGFVGYILVLAVFALGSFPPPVDSVLRSIGLKSAAGIFCYLLAGLLVSYVFLWRKTGELRRWRELIECRLMERRDPAASDPSGLEAADDPEGL